MSRRSGQSGNLVKQSGWWRVRFRLDQPGIEVRKQISIKVAPVNTRLSRPELERRAKEIVQAAGANSEERFNQVALGEVKNGLLFQTGIGTPHLYANLEDRWLTPRLIKLGLDEEGMGWHSFKRFRKTWLRGRRCLEDINNYWMGHVPQTMSELYSHLSEELEIRLEEAERVGYGFDLPKEEAVIAPNAPKKSNTKLEVEIAA
jgi:hypothetical protein